MNLYMLIYKFDEKVTPQAESSLHSLNFSFLRKIFHKNGKARLRTGYLSYETQIELRYNQYFSSKLILSLNFHKSTTFLKLLQNFLEIFLNRLLFFENRINYLRSYSNPNLCRIFRAQSEFLIFFNPYS